MFLIRETPNFLADLEWANLPGLRRVLENSLYPWLEIVPRRGVFSYPDGQWHARVKILPPLLVARVAYTIDDEAGTVTLHELDVFED